MKIKYGSSLLFLLGQIKEKVLREELHSPSGDITLKPPSLSTVCHVYHILQIYSGDNQIGRRTLNIL